MFNKIKKRIPFTYYPYKNFMHKHRCIFIHIPKNAGTSVLSLFHDTSGRKHAKWYDFHESNDYFFRKYHKFAIVREPLDRLYSAYCYAVDGGNQSNSDLEISRQIKSASIDFNSFVESVLNAEFMMMNLLFLPQYLFIYNCKREIKVDTLLHFETLDTDWQNLSVALKLNKRLPKVNISAAQKNLKVLSSKSRDKVSKLYRLDYELFGYEVGKD